LISQAVGYTEKSTGQIKIPVLDEIQPKLEKFEVDFTRLQAQQTANGNFGKILQDCFIYRADIINTFVEPLKGPKLYLSLWQIDDFELRESILEIFLWHVMTKFDLVPTVL